MKLAAILIGLTILCQSCQSPLLSEDDAPETYSVDVPGEWDVFTRLHDHALIFHGTMKSTSRKDAERRAWWYVSKGYRHRSVIIEPRRVERR